MTTLVTGGTGFLGSALVRRLVAAGTRVRVLDNNWRGRPRRLAGIEGQVEMVEADIRDAEGVARAMAGVERVFHLSAVNGTRYFYEQPELVIDVAIRGILNVVDACRAHGVQDLVVASSSEAYQTPPVVPTPENVPLVVPDVLNPRYSYGGSKLASELIALNATGIGRVIVFRPHNVYGPDMGFEHVVPEFILRAHRLAAEAPEGVLAFPIKGDGTQTRAFIYVDDFIDGLMIAADKGEHRGIYHIGNPVETSIAELATEVVAALGRSITLKPETAPAGETSRRCPDIAKLASLGFAPTTSLGEGLAKTIPWYLANTALAPS